MALFPRVTRRVALRGFGTALALPWLEATAGEPSVAGSERRHRFVFIYGLPYGVDRQGWRIDKAGRDFAWSKTLASLAPFREQVSVLSGLLHIRNRAAHHAGCLSWLNGQRTVGTNSTSRLLGSQPSIDQIAAKHIGHHTRHPSLQIAMPLQSGSGVALSYDLLGRPLLPRRGAHAIFSVLFPDEASRDVRTLRQVCTRDRSVLDRALADAAAFSAQLGQADRGKLDEYMSTVRDLEQRIARNERFLDTPIPRVDAGGIAFEAADAQVMVRSHLDLAVLALQTDQTRVISFPFAMDTINLDLFSRQAVQQVLGSPGHWHGVGHCEYSAEDHAKFDAWIVSHLAYLLGRLAAAKEGNESLLDRTIVVFGGGQFHTHNYAEFPLVVAGGKALGMRHGQHLRYPVGTVPLSNLFVTIMQKAGLPVESFCESTGTLAEL